MQLLQPQEFPLEVPPTEPELQHRRQPHEELEELPQVQVHVQRLEVLESLEPLTEPELRQQGLQQELATKPGNTMPP